MACSSRVVRSASLASPRPQVPQGGVSGQFRSRHQHHTLAHSYRRRQAECKSVTEPDSPTTLAGRLGPLDFSPEDLASQLSLLDLPVFKAIAPDELSSCSWNKKNKLEAAPNVVAFIRRFNHVSFWTVQSVLAPETPRRRAEVLAHFVRVAKKLHELNNLHAEFAVLSALQSAAVFRLSRTWAGLSRKDRANFERLSELFSERDNFARLREHMNATALGCHQDCIPYLGLYLTDLIYVDMAHPHSGGLESQQRQLKMNNILRIVSELQQSTYEHLPVIPTCQAYLKSIRYIDELQKFIEDDNYKLSLRLEPNPSSGPSSSSSKESVISGTAKNSTNTGDPGLMAELNLSPAKSHSARISKKAPFVPGHRKCRSDGANIFLSCSGGGAAKKGNSDDLSSWASGTLSSDAEGDLSRHNLIDDSLLEDPTEALATVKAKLVASTTSPEVETSSLIATGKPRHHHSDKSSRVSATSAAMTLSPGDVEQHSMVPGMQCTFEGCLKRKTLIKEGRKPAMSGGWQRYWLQLWGSSLVYYAPRTLAPKGLERKDFRSDPAKCQAIDGWMVMVTAITAVDEEIGHDVLSFQLTDPVRKSVYRFRAPSPEMAAAWLRYLHEATTAAAAQEAKRASANLISFE